MALEVETKMSGPPMSVKSFEGNGRLRMSRPRRGRRYLVPPAMRREELTLEAPPLPRGGGWWC